MLQGSESRTTSPPSSLSKANMILALFLCMIVADISGLLILSGEAESAFMNAYEAIAAVTCLIACVIAFQSSRRERWAWAFVASTFFLFAVTDIHDFLIDVHVWTLEDVPSLLQTAGWCARIPIALLVFYPSYHPQRSRLPWCVAFFDFLQSALAICLAFYCFIYLPHSVSGTPWTIITKSDVVRDIALAGGLLFRMIVEPSDRLRRFYREIGGVLITMFVARHLIRGYLSIPYAVLRPSLFLLLAFFALRWSKSTQADSIREGFYRTMLRFCFTIIAAANLVVVQALAPIATGGWHAETYIIGAASGLIFLTRHVMAEFMRADVEAELRESDERFRKAFMTSADAFYICTLEEGRILEANDCFFETLGHTREESVGKTTRELGMFETPEIRNNFVKELQSEGLLRNREAIAIRKNGEVFTALISASLLEGKGERLFLGIFRDITDQKKSAQKVRDIASQWQTTFDAVQDMVMLLDRDFQITRANHTAITCFGQPFEQIAGRHCCELMHCTSESTTNCPVTMTFKTKAHTETDIQLGDGRWVHVSADPVFDSSGEVSQIVYIAHDITDRRSLEQRFLQSQKMEAVGQLAGGVAHDFNNLLGIITGYVELILRDGSLSEKLRGYLEQIEVAGFRGAEVTRQLLTFSRTRNFKPRALNLNDQISGTKKLITHALGEDISIETSLCSDLGTVMADPTGIDQILLNLALNARDAMPRGGRLVIESANVILDEPDSAPDRVSGSYVMLAVSDNGIGMEPKIQSHIFEPFFTTKERGRGTGLGLSTVYGIVEQCGGRIKVYSEPGFGSTFKLYFPMVAEASDGLMKKNAEAVSGGSETILLVEDDPSLRALNVELLSGLGYKVIEAENGADALIKSADFAGPLDLLLTDVIMPGMNGVELSEYLGELRPEMRTIFISGYSENLIKSATLNGKSSFLQKPVAARILAEKIRELLGPPKAER